MTKYYLAWFENKKTMLEVSQVLRNPPIRSSRDRPPAVQQPPGRAGRSAGPWGVSPAQGEGLERLASSKLERGKKLLEVKFFFLEGPGIFFFI